jgi:hypothetical protein
VHGALGTHPISLPIRGTLCHRGAYGTIIGVVIPFILAGMFISYLLDHTDIGSEFGLG